MPWHLDQVNPIIRMGTLDEMNDKAKIPKANFHLDLLPG
jgi:hypothetical protein